MMLKGITDGAKLRGISAKLWIKASSIGNCCAIAHIVFPGSKDEREIPIKVQEVLKQLKNCSKNLLNCHQQKYHCNQGQNLSTTSLTNICMSKNGKSKCKS